MSFRQAMPPEPPTMGCAPGPRWGTSVPPDPLCPSPPPNPGYATGGASHIFAKLEQLNISKISESSRVSNTRVHTCRPTAR